jgi:hypothetical protein
MALTIVMAAAAVTFVIEMDKGDVPIWKEKPS